MPIRSRAISYGRALVFTFSGTISRDEVTCQLWDELACQVTDDTEAIILDLTAAGIETTSTQDALWLREATARLDDAHDFLRPHVLVAPQDAQFGVSKMVEAFLSGIVPVTVCRSMEEALAAIGLSDA